MSDKLVTPPDGFSSQTMGSLIIEESLDQNVIADLNHTFYALNSLAAIDDPFRLDFTGKGSGLSLDLFFERSKYITSYFPSSFQQMAGRYAGIAFAPLTR